MSRPNEGQATGSRSRLGFLVAALVVVVVVWLIVSVIFLDNGAGSNDQAAEATPPTSFLEEPEPTVTSHEEPIQVTPEPLTPAEQELAEAETAWDAEDVLEEKRLKREAWQLVGPIWHSWDDGAPAELAIRELVELSCQQTTANPFFWDGANDLYRDLWNEVVEGLPVDEVSWPTGLAEAWAQNCDS